MTTTIANVAEELLVAGLSVIPVDKSKKATIEWKQFSVRPLEPSEAERVFAKSVGVALISGSVSGGVECIDFDAHDKDITEIFDRFTSDDGVKTIVERNGIYCERSPRGGYHLIYMYESSSYDGAQGLAWWENGDTMIETRGTGSYTVVSPTPGYVVMYGDLMNLPKISREERDYMVDFAKTFNVGDVKQGEATGDKEKTAMLDNTDPVSWYNWHKTQDAKAMLVEKGWEMLEYDKRQGLEYWRRPGKDEGYSATWGRKDGQFFVFTSAGAPLKEKCYYTAFQLLVRFKFSGSYRAAQEWVVMKYMNEDVPYIRVGIDYFKRILKTDRFGIDGYELKHWSKDEIKLDHGKPMMEKIPRFDDFTIEPNNIEYMPVVNNCYNLYREFSHRPKQGSWKWTKVLLEHIFGEQYDLGIRYLQILYLYPKHIMPILVLVSRERQTGKTTFLNWLNMIFRDNVANISPDDLTNGFNSQYAASNIIAVEETMIEKAGTVEKLKALATSKFTTVNQKYVSQYRMPFFGKIILTSNNEDKFAKIDQEEIRFFIRKVGIPTNNHKTIEDDLPAEIPAFLHYLSTLPPQDFKNDRTGFTPEELNNDSLRKVKEESRTWFYKDLRVRIEQWFMNEASNDDEIYIDVMGIKEKWYRNDSTVNLPFIRQTLKQDFKMIPIEKTKRYKPFGNEVERVGKPYMFSRKEFTDVEAEIKCPF